MKTGSWAMMFQRNLVSPSELESYHEDEELMVGTFSPHNAVPKLGMTTICIFMAMKNSDLTCTFICFIT
jgi:hypothetical protein